MNKELTKSPRQAISNMLEWLSDFNNGKHITWEHAASFLYHEGKVDINKADLWNTYKGKYESEKVVAGLRNAGWLAPKKKRIRYTMDTTVAIAKNIDEQLENRGYTRRELAEMLPVLVSLLPYKTDYE